MQTYVILRRSAWGTPEELGAAAERSRQIADQQMSGDICWIRSYVLDEVAGAVGTVCVYQASSARAIRDHADRVGMSAGEVIPVADTVVIHPDPEPDAGRQPVNR